jgi:phosphate acyltransferase
MNIGLDIMGGDFAPNETVKGAILAQKLLNGNEKIVLFGDDYILSVLSKLFG